MKRTAKLTIGGMAATVVLGGGALMLAGVADGAGGAGGSDGADDAEPAITGTALDRATAAALAHTGGGTVTDTEVGDEESHYEVEVTLADGRQVDVQLDESFQVVDSIPDGDGESDAEGDR